MKMIFVLAGFLSAFHLYTYGRWEGQRKNAAAAFLAYLLAAAAVVFPLYHWLSRLF